MSDAGDELEKKTSELKVAAESSELQPEDPDSENVAPEASGSAEVSSPTQDQKIEDLSLLYPLVVLNPIEVVDDPEKSAAKENPDYFWLLPNLPTSSGTAPVGSSGWVEVKTSELSDPEEYDPGPQIKCVFYHCNDMFYSDQAMLLHIQDHCNSNPAEQIPTRPTATITSSSYELLDVVKQFFEEYEKRAKLLAILQGLRKTQPGTKLQQTPQEEGPPKLVRFGSCTVIQSEHTSTRIPLPENVIQRSCMKLISEPSTLEELPLISEAPPLISEGPSLISEGPPLISEKPPLLYEEPPLHYEEPPLLYEEPALLYEEPPLLYEEPPQLYEKPPLISEGPPQISEEPPLISEKPPLLYKEPPLLYEEPPLLYKEPPLLYEEPPLLYEEPPLISEAPSVISEKRRLISEKPPLISEEPPLLYEEPPLLYEEPPLLYEKPPLISEAPPLISEKRPLISEAPPLISEKRPLIAETPSLISEEPRETPFNSPAREDTREYKQMRLVVYCAYEACMERFANYPEMHTHFRTHGSTHICTECWKAFGTVAHMNLHELRHMQYKPYQCSFDMCGRRFYLSADLRQHTPSHCDGEPYVCPYILCGERFPSRDELTDHMIIHVGT